MRATFTPKPDLLQVELGHYKIAELPPTAAMLLIAELGEPQMRRGAMSFWYAEAMVRQGSLMGDTAIPFTLTMDAQGRATVRVPFELVDAFCWAVGSLIPSITVTQVSRALVRR